MIRLIVILWFFLPALVVMWHIGPGQRYLMEDQAGRQIRKASQFEQKAEWDKAAKAYAAARQQLPHHSTDLRRRLKIAEATALNRSGQFDAGRQLLQDVVSEMEADPQIDPIHRNLTQHELASISYYSAWRMRLDGRPADQWRPVAELAREQFNALAQEARRQATTGIGQRSTDAQRNLRIFRRNLEAAVKMQYMHVTELKKRTLPDMYVRPDDAVSELANEPEFSESGDPSQDNESVDDKTADETEEIKEQI